MNRDERDEIVRYRMDRAKETYREVQVLAANGFYNGAINRLYYACYYAVIALLIDNEIDAQTHAGVRQMFGLHFVKTGRIDPELGKFYSSIYRTSTFAFDLWNDNLVDTVWMYLRKNLPAFRGGTDIGQLPRTAVGESGNIIAVNVPALRHG